MKKSQPKKDVATAPPVATPPQQATPKSAAPKDRPPEKQAEYLAKKERARERREA